MITSFIYSHDVVSRLSLGSIRDLSRACWWLSDGKDEESCTSIIKRSWGLEVTSGLGWWGKDTNKQEKKEDDKDFVRSISYSMSFCFPIRELHY
jgi:hypothetical protein